MMAHKSRMISFRVSEKDYLTIKGKASKAKLNISAFVTNAALDKRITMVEGLNETARELKGIGRNLNQLTTLCNMGKIQSLDLNDVKEVLCQIYVALVDAGEGRR